MPVKSQGLRGEALNLEDIVGVPVKKVIESCFISIDEELTTFLAESRLY